MKVAEAESDKDGGGLTIGSITGAAILTIVIICIPACPNSGGLISDLEGHRLSYISVSKDDLDPVQSPGKESTSRCTSLLSMYNIPSKTVVEVVLAVFLNGLLVAIRSFHADLTGKLPNLFFLLMAFGTVLALLQSRALLFEFNNL
ncbi:hypothetical protein FOPG_17723 [Fusarium oxysporum f. sp. conglutinans race 2 54008]|uniref:Uncharacterized protein n=2 Tax=Fusarium oxysporum TaxID=5507 RepID=X0HY82_FUSOX|nr:hypothetical protein FOVG_16900 [Fusarium oxysporum f. sp. pisi HDV247]EXL66079.1 hypothetical protein FOPG_17723 [Fusarium oxysporum f. sp. conglutinans race 2 54008]